MAIIASGEAATPSFDVSAKAVVVTMNNMIDPDGRPSNIKATVSIADLAGKYGALPAASGQAYDSALSASGIVAQVAVKDIVQKLELAFDLSVAQPGFTGKTVMVAPELMQSGNMSAALAAGFMIEGEYSTGPISTKLDMTENGTPARSMRPLRAPTPISR